MTTTLPHPNEHGHVLIIGGGIAGNALALFLQKAGISCAVYEAYSYKDAVGGGLGLAPNGMNVLAALGLADAVKAQGSLALENCFYNGHGRILARMKNGSVEQYGQPAVSLLRPSLYDVLTEAAQRQGVHIEYHKRLRSITQDGDKIVAYFEDGTSALGDVLIGADGVRSQTRRLILPDAPEPEFVGIIGVGGVTPASALTGMTTRQKQAFSFTYGAQGFFGYCGGANGDMLWWSNLPRDKELSRDELTNFSLEELQRDMLALFGDFHEPIPTMIRNTHSPIKHNIHDIQSLPRWHRGRVLLIGDAAHAVSPNSGQGASMALEDAIYLAKLLRDSENYEKVFAQFEHDRKPRVEKIVAEGRRRGGDKGQVSPLAAVIRDVMMTIFINLFGVRGLEEVYSYKIDWDEKVPVSV